MNPTRYKRFWSDCEALGAYTQNLGRLGKNFLIKKETIKPLGTRVTDAAHPLGS
jgi:hypothetical protein